jgi:hypothetical protein
MDKSVVIPVSWALLLFMKIHIIYVDSSLQIIILTTNCFHHSCYPTRLTFGHPWLLTTAHPSPNCLSCGRCSIQLEPIFRFKIRLEVSTAFPLRGHTIKPVTRKLCFHSWFHKTWNLIAISLMRTRTLGRRKGSYRSIIRWWVFRWTHCCVGTDRVCSVPFIPVTRFIWRRETRRYIKFSGLICRWQTNKSIPKNIHIKNRWKMTYWLQLLS